MNGTPLGFAVQPDSKILVIGNFSDIAGQNRYNNSRLNSDGTFDFSFFASGAVNPIRAVGLATNGDVFFGGEFVRFGGVDRPYLIRVTGSGGVGIFFTWPNGPTRTLAIQADGKLLAGGEFTSIGGVTRAYLARLNADNSVDSTFDPGANNSVYCLALQMDGKILVGGTFTGIAGAARSNLARLNPNGTLDPSFSASAAGIPNVLLVQPDGKILVGSDYLSTPPGSNYCRRLNADGSLDAAFNPVLTHAAAPGVNALTLQADGKIIVGGTFDTLGGIARSNLGRLFPDGSTDLSFNPAVGSVASLALQPDGRVLFGGLAQLGRLVNTDSATNSLYFDNSSATWLRGGTTPEVWRAAFELTTNGVDWFNLAEGVRIAAGWQCTNLSLPSFPVIIRARGFVTGGNWFDEQVAGPPIITSQPAGGTRNATTSITIGASVTGPGLVYQWLKNGASFTPGNGSGVQSPSLTLTNLLAADAGQYQLFISNSWGSATSQVASLTVNDPALTSQPIGISTNIGRAAKFFVGVAGTQPLSYQWFKDGVAVPGAFAPSFTLTNIQPSDAGNYLAIITNQYGMRTSRVAPLVVSQVALWGYSAYGEGTFAAGLTNIVAISGGAIGPGDCLALRSDGVVIAWPSLSWGAESNFIAIAAGYNFDLALKSDGTVTYQTAGGTKPSGLSNVVAIAQNNYSSFSAPANLALRADGSLTGSASLPGLSNLVAVSQGYGYSLGLRADGTVVGWGNNNYGQTNTPLGLSNVIAIASGYYHGLALKEDGTVLAWGRNAEQQTNVPPALSNVVAIAAGGSHSMALKSDGMVVAWGANTDGQTNVPPWLTNVTAIAAGQYHSMALLGSGPPVVQAALANPAIGTNGFQVSSPSQSGRVFILQHKNSPTDLGWVSAPLVPGNGGVVVLTDLTVTNSSERLYRVIRR